MSSCNKFEETRLPPKEALYGNLYNTDINKYDCGHTQRVWKAFKLKNVEEYHDHYLKIDMLLLNNLFETFRYL